MTRFIAILLLATSIFGIALLTPVVAQERVVNDPPPERTVRSIYGAVPVVFVPNLKDEKGQDLLGMWEPVARVITIRAGLRADWTDRVIQHERCHMLLDDWQVQIHPVLAERVCDAMMSVTNE